MAKKLQCAIVTPSAAVFDEEVTYVSLPAWDGQLGVMPGESPILTQLGVGSMRLDTPDGKQHWYLIDGGFAQISSDGVNVLTEQAIAAADLSLEEAQAELAEANARVTTPGEDQDRVTRDQRRAMAKKALIASTRG